MNKIHKFSVAIVAVVMIAGFSAFKMSESKMDEHRLDYIPWYFIGDDVEQVTNSGQYSNNPSHESNCFGNPEVVCKIFAPDNGGQPDLSEPSDPSNPSSPSIMTVLQQTKTNTSIVSPAIGSYREL